MSLKYDPQTPNPKTPHPNPKTRTLNAGWGFGGDACHAPSSLSAHVLSVVERAEEGGGAEEDAERYLPDTLPLNVLPLNVEWSFYMSSLSWSALRRGGRRILSGTLPLNAPPFLTMNVEWSFYTSWHAPRRWGGGRLSGNQPPCLTLNVEWSGYLRLIDSCITQLKAQGPSRTCNESKEEEKKGM